MLGCEGVAVTSPELLGIPQLLGHAQRVLDHVHKRRRDAPVLRLHRNWVPSVLVLEIVKPLCVFSVGI